ncbi:MAG TPA: DUF58 domain-containing protein [Pirellulaceae bacterium]|nr:DUF58 domain-containing protein [Pirellulaceae bacterium]
MVSRIMPSDKTQETLLTPELLSQLDRMELVSRKVFRGRMKGERRSKRKGQSVEFADYRNYVHGDDLRFIDWNLYARLERLFLKLYMEEEDLHFYALVDCSHSMDFGEPTKFVYAKQLAAALGYVGLCRSDRIKVEPLGSPFARQAPVLRGRQSLWRMLDFLNQIPCGADIPLEDSLKSFCLRNRGKGILVLITDLMNKTGFEQPLKYLIARDLDVYVIHVLSRAEIEPDLAGDLRLIDCEDGDVREITVSSRLIERYKDTLARFTQGARDFCTKRNVTYMMTSTDLPVEQLISRFLRQRGMVR